MFRAGFVTALASSGLHVVGEAAGAKDALELAAGTPIDVAVIDLMMPSVSGISLTSELRTKHPRCRILGISGIDEPSLIASMLIAGATGFALKVQPIEEIIEAIKLVAGHVRYLPPSVSRAAVELALATTRSRPLATLTLREREVFELVIRGHANGEIATRLSISCRTVETHRQRCANKLAAHSLVAMIRVNAVHGGLGFGG